MISYGNVNLAFMDTPAAVTAARALDGADLFDFAELSGRDSLTFTWPGLPCPRPVQVGSLLWPWGASRFAYAHMLATDAELARIRPLVYGAKGTAWNPLALKFDDARTGRSVAPSLYMLPPKPLDQITGANGLSLLTLVDDRFRWWERAGAVTVTPGTTTWAVLIAAIATALGVTITVDTIAAAYLKPAADLAGADVYLPPLLDRVLACVGQRLVRRLDGTVRTQNPTTAKASQDAQLATWTKEKGGQYLFSAATKPNDLTALVPAQVLVTFPSLPAAAPAPADAPFTEMITLASLALPEFAGVTGHAGTKLIHTTAVYDGTNAAEVLALARQVARDFYRWRLGRQHVRFAGIDPYTPEALSDHVEWLSRGGECSTWVRRGPGQEWEGEAPLPYQDSKGSATPMPLPGTDPGGGGGIIGLWFVTPGTGSPPAPAEVNTKAKIFYDNVTFNKATYFYVGPINFGGDSNPVVVNFNAGDEVNFYGSAVFWCCIEWVPLTYTLSGTVNNWAPACAPILRVNTSGGEVTITGMVAVCDWQVVTIKNYGPARLVIKINNTNSSQGNRFGFSSWWPLDHLVDANYFQIVLDVDESAVFWHDESDADPNNWFWDTLVLNAAMKPRGSDHSPGMVRDSGTDGADTDYWARNATWKSIPGTSPATLAHDVAGNTSFATSSATYVDVTGASFANLPDGVYQIIARVGVSRTPGSAGENYSAKVTDGTIIIDEQDSFFKSQVSGVAVVAEVTLVGYYTAAGSPTVKVQVKTSAGSATFNAQMIHLKIG